MTAPCPACGSSDLEAVVSIEGVPTSSCLLLDDADEARTFRRGDLDLAVCHGCGFLTNRAFEPAAAEYSERYEETQAYSPRFVDFGRSLARRWVRDHDLQGRHVLEIGCGKGEFLTWMVEAGAGSGTGIDPGVHPERVDPGVADRLTWIGDRYDDRYAHLTADAVVCRHTLEHIGPVGAFLRGLRRHLDGADIPVLFELPDTRRVLDECAFWDVYYEHCSYFTGGSLARTFRAAGFEVTDLRLAYDDQYLLLEARPCQVATPDVPPLGPVEDDVDTIVKAARRYRAEVDRTLERWRRRLAVERVAGRRTVLWGGGSKAVAFLTMLDRPEEVTGVVDINPHKQGRYLAGTAHRVCGPQDLSALRPDLVVVMNPVYLAEIRADLAARGVDAKVEAL